MHFYFKWILVPISFFPLWENICTFESHGSQLTLLSGLRIDILINVNWIGIDKYCGPTQTIESNGPWVGEYGVAFNSGGCIVSNPFVESSW